MAEHGDREKAFVDMMNRTEYTFADFQKSLHAQLPEPKKVDLSNKVVVVTGGNAGIGLDSAKTIAAMNPSRLILACRNAEKAANAVAQIKATGYANVEAWSLDLASIASVKAFAKKFNESNIPLDVLLSNAGLASMGGDWEVSADGYEIVMQVNHIANMLLILLLTPSINRSKSPRIVVVASDVHFWADANPEDPTPLKSQLVKPEHLNPFHVYPNTKIFNVLFAQEYARRAPTKAWICSANPGYTQSELGQKEVSTGAAKNNGAPHNMPKRSTHDGAKTIIYCATDDEIEKNPSGGYYSESGPARRRTTVQGEKGADWGKRLWADTLNSLEKFADGQELASFK